MDIRQRILELKAEKDALILAHYYQTMDIQNVADIVGDSFELAKRASAAENSVIVLCGVRFMAESAKILNPGKKVLLPAFDAGCPMADMVTPGDVRDLRTKYPNAAVMCYVNSSAAVKAESDICCTSSSAVKIAKKLEARRIIFIPDKNLGSYVAEKTPEKEFILFNGYCHVHHKVKAEEVLAAKAAKPGAPVLTHPECTPEVRALSDFIGSTAEILNFAQSTDAKELLICTERGVVDRLAEIAPDKRAFLVSPRLICPNMKKTHMEDVLHSLETGEFEISLPERELTGARASLDKMVALGS